MVVTTGTPLARAAISVVRRPLAPSGYGWINKVAWPAGTRRSGGPTANRGR